MPIVNGKPPCPICDVPVSLEVYAWFAQLAGEDDVDPGTVTIVDVEEDDDVYLQKWAGDAAEHWKNYHNPVHG